MEICAFNGDAKNEGYVLRRDIIILAANLENYTLRSLMEEFEQVRSQTLERSETLSESSKFVQSQLIENLNEEMESMKVQVKAQLAERGEIRI
jgi:hypothetical protein